MKKILALVLTLSAWGFFSTPVFADQIYQQLTDSSEQITLSHAGVYNVKVGSFIVTATTTMTGGKGLVVVENDSGFANGDVNFWIASTTSFAGSIYDALCFSSASLPFSHRTDVFVDLACTQNWDLRPNVTYYIYGETANPIGVSMLVRSNLSKDFFYGYITNGSGESLPIAPGIAGFTNVGISTTSQQVWCNTNFSTSSGLLDNLGQSISLAICNVGVFLFVPDTGIVNNYTNGWTLLTTKHFPFSWITQMRTILESYTATTSQNFPTVSLAFGTTTKAVGISTLNVIGTTSLSQYMSDDTRNAAKLLLTVSFYLTAFAFIYRDLQRVWHKNHA